jgi:putative flippase GtrA
LLGFCTSVKGTLILTKLAFNYVLFALISTLVNLSTQVPFFWLFEGPWVLYVALFFGTLTGLLTKYVLDKKWIFSYQSTSKKDEAHKFGLYSLMGVFTTVIFWGTEMFFYHVFSFTGSQYVGGALGLMIGYVVKYQLDKRFVFKEALA